MVAKPDALPRPDALLRPADSDERPRDHPAVRVIADSNRPRRTNCIVGDHQRPPLLEKGGGREPKPPPQLLQTTDTDEIEAQRMDEGAGGVGERGGGTPFQSAKDTGADCSSIGRYSPVAAPTGPSRG